MTGLPASAAALSRAGGAMRLAGLLLGLVIGLISLAPAQVAHAQPTSGVTRPTNWAAPEGDYRIGPLDRLNITVLQVAALSMQKVQVDASGQLPLPLIGSITAAGKTTTELSKEIAARLSERYLRSPQVSVSVDEAASQKITVEGEVNQAGVFEMRGRTSLMEAVAMAKGPSSTANLKHVAIVRSIDGTPSAAVFDMAAIRAGRAPNPEVLGGDVVVVDGSRTKAFWRDVIKAMPAFSLLTLL